MTWWAWLLQLGGLALITFSMWLTFSRARREKPLNPWSLLAAMLGAIVAAVLFIALSPSRPPAAALVPLLLIGPVLGAGVSMTARLDLYGKALVSSQGEWYALVWCGFLLLAALLVIAGPAASDVAVSIGVFASLATVGYVLTIYLRYVSMAYRSA